LRSVTSISRSELPSSLPFQNRVAILLQLPVTQKAPLNFWRVEFPVTFHTSFIKPSALTKHIYSWRITFIILLSCSSLSWRLFFYHYSTHSFPISTVLHHSSNATRLQDSGSLQTQHHNILLIHYQHQTLLHQPSTTSCPHVILSIF